MFLIAKIAKNSQKVNRTKTIVKRELPDPLSTKVMYKFMFSKIIGTVLGQNSLFKIQI